MRQPGCPAWSGICGVTGFAHVASSIEVEKAEIYGPCCRNRGVSRPPFLAYMARDIANTDAYLVSRRQRKKVEMLAAHLKRLLKLDRLCLRGLNKAKDEFYRAAAAQNLRKLAKMQTVPGLGPA